MNPDTDRKEGKYSQPRSEQFEEIPTFQYRDRPANEGTKYLMVGIIILGVLCAYFFFQMQSGAGSGKPFDSDKLEDKIRKQIGIEIDAKINKEIQRKVQDELSNRVQKVLNSKIEKELGSRIDGEMSSKIDKEIKKVDREVDDRIGAEISRVQKKIDQQIDDKISASISRVTNKIDKEVISLEREINNIDRAVNSKISNSQANRNSPPSSSSSPSTPEPEFVRTIDRSGPIKKVSNPINVPDASSEGHHNIQDTWSWMHKDPPMKFDFPTLGMPIPGTTFNSTLVEVKDMKEFDRALIEMFRPFNETDCDYARYGPPHEGGYTACRNYFKGSEALINVGIRGTDDFGCAVTTQFPMPNYQYDCTNDTIVKCETNKGGNQYSLICTGAVTEKNNQNKIFYSFEDLLRSRDLLSKHISLKIDTEAGEFNTFMTFPISYLDYVDQIIIEWHFWSYPSIQWGYLDIVKSITDHLIPVYFAYGNGSACDPVDDRPNRQVPSVTSQMSLVNKKIIKKRSEKRSYDGLPMTFKNHPAYPDCV